MMRLSKDRKRYGVIVLAILLGIASPTWAETAPSSYSAYTGTDPKASPYPPPPLGPANSILIDPTFGSRILRVTDAKTAGGMSLIPENAGYFRTWNADSTALKLKNTNGKSWWVSFDPIRFSVGGGSSQPALHPLNIDYSWEWSAVNPDVIYFMNGNQIAQYNKATNTAVNLGGPPNGDPVTYHVSVVGPDNWVCTAAGAGTQDTYTKIFCLNPRDASQNKFIDILSRTINGQVQNDPNWPTSAPGQVIGVHSIFGSSGGSWLGVVFVQQSWGANGVAVLNLATNRWSLARADSYMAGHTSLGNGRYVNACGSTNGMDSRGAMLRDPNNLMDSSQYRFLMQPPSTVGWYDSEHSSWFNSATNPNAPILFSRYNISTPPTPLTWYGEIVMAATDGSNTVWRFAHNHNGSGNFYGQAFAQISNDGRWALFSSYWDGTLGPSGGDFGLSTRIDTFIVELVPSSVQTAAPAPPSNLRFR
ncbi:MAG TPA: hypothetical protein VFS39_03855 [Nitrospira sp.]|nr:hypothetical protein [Nitrospira sp.]